MNDQANIHRTRAVHNEFQWLRQVAADADLPPIAARAAIALTRYFNNKEYGGWSWVSQAKLASDLGVSEVTARRTLAAMVKRGHLLAKRRGCEETNMYHLALSDRSDLNVQDRSDLNGHEVVTDQTCPSDRSNQGKVTDQKRSPIPSKDPKKEPNEERDSFRLDLGDREDGRRRQRTPAPGSLVWTCACSEPIEGQHYNHSAASSAGKYSISVQISFPGLKFIGYDVEFCPTGMRWSEGEVKLGVKPKLEDAKAVAQRHADAGNERTQAAQPSAEIEAQFEAFWVKYPLKKAKAAALKAYRAVITKGLATHDQLMAGVLRYAAERSGQDPRWTKHPATWLNGGCWSDEPTTSIGSGSPAHAAPGGGNDHIAKAAAMARQAQARRQANG